METKSLNLNIEFYKGKAFIKIYTVKGTNPKTKETETLGIYTSEDKAKENKKFWKETMGYEETHYIMDLAWI